MTEQHTRVAAYALCRDERGRLLLCRIAPGELDAGRWTLPGGGLDFGESPADGVVRELREETGLDGQITDIAAVDSRLYPPNAARSGDLHAIRIIYRVAITGGALRDEPDGSTDRCAWLDPGAAADLPLLDLAEIALSLPATRRG